MKVIVLVFILIGGFVSADDSKKAIDLGDLEVQGEVRRPQLSLIESNQETQRLLLESVERRLKAFEDKITKFKSEKDATRGVK